MSSHCQLSAWTPALERHPGRTPLEDDFIRPDQELTAGQQLWQELAPSPASLSAPPIWGKLWTQLRSKGEPQQPDPCVYSASDFAHHLCHLMHIQLYDYCRLKSEEYGVLQIRKHTQTSNSQLISKQARTMSKLLKITVLHSTVSTFHTSLLSTALSPNACLR